MKFSVVCRTYLASRLAFLNSVGLLVAFSAALFGAVPLAAQPLDEWSNMDIGTPGLAGSGTYDSTTDVYTIKGSGADIGGAADKFHFSYRGFSGDGVIVARVNSLTSTLTAAKVGIMIRETLLSNSKHALMMVTPGSGVGIKTRTTTGGASTSVLTAGVTAPQWLKLERHGNVFSGYFSADGVTWTLSHRIVIPMATDIYVGLAVCSGSTAVLNTGIVDEVMVDSANSTTALPWPWQEATVGMPTDAGVAIYDGSYVLANLGADIASTSDKMKFVTQSLTGDGTLTVKISSLTSGATAPRFGIMMRDTLSANARNVLLGLTTPQDLVFQSRQTPGGTTALRATSVTVAFPTWLKLERNGNAFTASYSTDGQTWIQQGVETIEMPVTIQAGVAYSNRSATLWGMGVGDELRLSTPTDTDGNGLPDAWEITHFAATGVNLHADPDSDGISNYQEWELGNDPQTYNAEGQRPLLELVNGDAQVAPTDTTLPQALVVRVKDALSGVPVAGIPVSFNVVSGAGQIGENTAWQTTLTVTSDANGLAQTQLKFSTRAGVTAVQASVGGGQQASLVTFNATALAGEDPFLFETADLGAPVQPGHTTYANAAYTLNVASSTIGASSDTGHFAWRTLTGDGYILARVASFDAVATSSRAGLIMRDSLAANSINASVFVTPSSGLAFQSRSSLGGTTTTTFKAGQNAPCWLLLRRAGNVFSAQFSADGVTWQNVAAARTLTMGSTVYVGLAAASADVLARSATIDNVRIAPATQVPWEVADIGTLNTAGVDEYINDAILMRAGGTRISASSDAFRYLYQPLPADGRIVARVAEQLAGQTSAKSGIMIRESLSSYARHVVLATVPATGVVLQKRTAANTVATTVATHAGPVPRWLKLEKLGSRIDAYSSADGLAWTQVGTVTGDYDASSLIGLAAHSTVTSAHTQTLFDEIQVEQFDGARGWNVAYYNGADFNSLRLRRREYALDHTWSAGEPPAVGVSSSAYSIRWEANFVPTISGIHTFTTLSAGAVRVTINGQSVINHWTPHNATEDSGQVSLIAGQVVRVVVEYANPTGDAARIQLRSSAAGQADAVVATGALLPVDLDLDGMDDSWELLHGLDPTTDSDADLDGDHDGFTHLLEFQLGLNPQQADDRVPGLLVAEEWRAVSGEKIRNLTGHSRFRTAPDVYAVLTQLDTVPNHADNYGSRICGYLIPPTTGSYSFAVSGDDTVEFWLSSNDDSLNRRLVARSSAYTALRDYDAKHEQTSAPVSLQAGQYYYFEVLHKEGSGGDHVSVTWTRPDAPRAVIAAPYIASFGLRSDDANDDGLPDAWQATHGISHQGAYDDFDNDGLINLIEHRLGLNPTVADHDTDGFSDGMETLAGTDAATATTATLTPWQATTIGTLADPSPINRLNADTFVIAAAAGTGLKLNQVTDDNLQFVHQAVTGDFELVARIGSAGSITDGLGVLMVRSSLDARAPTAILGVNSEGVHAVRTRTASTEALSSRMTFTPAHASPSAHFAGYWVKLRRQGDQLAFYCSSNGQSWTQLTTLPFASECVVGLGLTAASDEPLARKFSAVRLDVDPVVAPEPNTLPPGVTSQVIATINGSAGVTVNGQWLAHGTGLISQFFTGTLDYTFTVPADGIYQLGFEADSPLNSTGSTLFPVELSVDGHFVARVNLILPAGDTGIARIITPWLTAGTHTVRIRWDNTLSHRNIRINTLTVESLDGPDADDNGRADWIDERFAGLNTVKLSDHDLYVSPVSLDGKVRFRDLLHLTADAEPVAVHPAPGFGWYANVTLDENAVVELQADFENAGSTQSLLLEWKTLNLLDVPASFAGQTTQVRKGDSMRFTAFAPAESGGSAIITVTALGESPVVHPLTQPQSQAWVQAFATPGVYTITATYTDASSVTTTADTFTVEVIEAAFAFDPVVGLNDTAIVWDNPAIPANVLLEADQGLNLSLLGALPTGGSSFSLKTVNLADSYVVARLGEDGPIFDHAVVRSVRAASNGDTAIDVLSIYPDGSQLIGVPIIVSPLTDDTVVEVVIIVNGVTFEDGTTQKTFTKADFDAYGRIYVRFVYPAGLNTSFCHRVLIREGTTDLGSF